MQKREKKEDTYEHASAKCQNNSMPKKINVAILAHTCDRVYQYTNKQTGFRTRKRVFHFCTPLYSSRPSRPREVRGKASSAAAAQRKKSLGSGGKESSSSSVTVSGGNNGGCGGNASRRKSNGNGANGHSGTKSDDPGLPTPRNEKMPRLQWKNAPNGDFTT